MVKRTYDFTGIIQGVGFRPCVSRLAQERSLSGWIQNRSGRVRAEFTGPAPQIESLLWALKTNPPPLARIDEVKLVSHSNANDTKAAGFRILEGLSEESRNVMIPADVAICPDCRMETADPDDRRFAYPFTTCVNCGPRYTVITDMPYERHSTTMNKFPLCKECDREYKNPSDRRFHAETTCCPKCGPQLELLINGKTMSKGPDALANTRKALAQGQLVAVKGFGGFLLAADPCNPVAVNELRQRKKRPHKPFAVMGRNIDVVKNAFDISSEEENLLKSPQAPIVVIETTENDSPGFDLDLITPDTATLGVMLPTSPLHMLLCEADDSTPAFDFLIMTSGNRHSEPICLTTEEAKERLGGIADMILTHNRDINLRNDDSLCIVNSFGPQVWRRARGFAPSPIRLSSKLNRTVLAMGAEIKNTIALGYDQEVVISPHIGDLETPEAIEHMRLVADTLPSFLGKEVEAVAVDLNPDMHSSIVGRRIAEKSGIPVIEVQHHEAHALACLAENGLRSGLALALDGTGLAADGSIWGAELFAVEDGICTRLATFRPAPLPGGDSAVRRPSRQLVARLLQAGVPTTDERYTRVGATDEEIQVWKQQIENNLNCPVSSGAGRLFDSIAALLGCAPHETTYEGQPAIRLEALAKRHTGETSAKIPFSSSEINNMLQVDWSPFFSNLPRCADLHDRAPEYAMALHLAVVDAAVKMVEYARTRHPFRHVALSGGVLMNRIIHAELTRRIHELGCLPMTHFQTPPNDGCISLGQVVQADRILGD